MDEPNKDALPQEVLTQSDVERLLAQVAEQETATTVHKEEAAPERKSASTVHPYDFRQPAFLTASELRRLRLRHEEFLRSLAARLSIYLRLEFGLQMSKLQTVIYQKFVEGLQNPTHVTLFKLDSLRGISMLEIPPRLGLTIVDRLLGGPAHSATAESDLSEIEVTLLDQAVQTMLREWCSIWHEIRPDLNPVIVGHENNGRFLQTSARDTVLLVLAMESRLGDCMEQMQLAIPFYTLEPLVRELDAADGANEKPAQSAGAAGARWQPQFNDVRVPVTAVWPEQEISLADLGRLKVGDVVMLDERCSHQVHLRLARTPKFAGRLGTRGKSWAVEVTQPMKG